MSDFVRAITHKLGCTVLTVEDDAQRSRLIVYGVWDTLAAIEAHARLTGCKAVVRLK